MTVVHEFPELAETWSTEYLLTHCEGYRVDTPAGPLGFVERVLFSEENEPQALAVRTGRFQTRLVIVPLNELDEIRPEWEILRLRSIPPS